MTKTLKEKLNKFIGCPTAYGDEPCSECKSRIDAVLEFVSHEQASLLKRVEEEVIGEDIKVIFYDLGLYHQYANFFNASKAQQREALDKLKKRV